MRSTYEWKVWVIGHVIRNVHHRHLSFVLEHEHFEQGAVETDAKENQSIR